MVRNAHYTNRQGQIDKQMNVCAGYRRPDNLSAVGETREQARKRRRSEFVPQDEMMDASNELKIKRTNKKDQDAKERTSRCWSL